MLLAPIILFVYNRLSHTEQTINMLKANKLAKDSELYIYSDAPKNKATEKKVKEVRNYIKTIRGFKKITIIERKKNWGLANSIIDGVTQVINKYEKVIVLEDDLVTSPYFLQYMNDALRIYRNRKDIFSITGFNFPQSVLKIPKEYNKDVYLGYRCMSWGWATWKDRWTQVDWSVQDFEKFEQDKNRIKLFNRGGRDLYPMLKSQMEKKIDSWAIRFCYAHYKNDAYCLYPVQSFINNEGFDGSGVHCNEDKTNKLQNYILNNNIIKLDPYVSINNKLIKNFEAIYGLNLLQKIKLFLKRLLTW